MPSKLSNLCAGLGCLTPIIGIVLFFKFLFQSSILLGVITVILSFTATIIFIVLGMQIEEKRKLKQLELLQSFQPDLDDIHKLKAFTSYDLLTKIAIDQQQRKVYIWIPDTTNMDKITKAFVGMPYIIKTYNYSDILAVILSEDDYHTASLQRDSHITDLILDKLSEEKHIANSTNHPPVDKISSMDLEIVLNDHVKPKQLIRFYHLPYVKIRKDSPQYRSYFNERQKWFTLLQAIIHETEHKPEIERITKTSDTSGSDESLPIAPSKEATQIMLEVDTAHYSLSMEEEPKFRQDAPAQVSPDEKPLSYFEQLIKKNREQLRGDYNED